MAKKKKTMKFKWTIFAVVLLGALILLLYFWERMEEKRKEEELRARKVFFFDKDNINNITIKSDRANISLLKEDEVSWKLVKPVEAKADFKVVSGFITKLGELHFSKSFDISPAEFSSYGLLPPKAEVTLSEGKNKISFSLGEETPLANSVYIKRGNENRILLVDRGIAPVILKTVFDFRDKTVMKFDRREINKVQLIYPEKSFTLLKYEQDWQMVTPIRAKADPDEVNKVFDLLLELRVKKFEEEKTSDAKQYGFLKPCFKVLLDFNNGKSEMFLLGKNSEEGIYAKLGSRKEIYIVSSDILKKLPKKVFDLRNKKLAPFYRYEIKAITLSSKGKSIEIEKDLQDRWNIIKPVRAKGNPIEIENLVYQILNLRLKEFIDKSSLSLSSIGLNPPEKEIILRGENKKHLVSIKIGKMDNNKYASYAVNDLENQLGMIDYTFVRDNLNLDVVKFKEKETLTKGVSNASQ